MHRTVSVLLALAAVAAGAGVQAQRVPAKAAVRAPKLAKASPPPPPAVVPGNAVIVGGLRVRIEPPVVHRPVKLLSVRNGTTFAGALTKDTTLDVWVAMVVVENADTAWRELTVPVWSMRAVSGADTCANPYKTFPADLERRNWPKLLVKELESAQGVAPKNEVFRGGGQGVLAGFGVQWPVADGMSSAAEFYQTKENLVAGLAAGQSLRFPLLLGCPADRPPARIDWPGVGLMGLTASPGR